MEMMMRLMDEITDTERIQSLVKLIDHFQKNSFNWNDIYLATTNPGQEYSGTFAGSDGTNFFFRTEQNQIFVGKLSDLQQTPAAGHGIKFTAK
jgi:cell filamentation protein